jgi:histone deacetylase 1/2
MRQYYAPDFELNVRSSNMENSNSREYLDKITAAVIDNLRQTGPAPSVQMQDVPRKPFGGMTDEEEAELDDLDEDENKDVRMSERQWEKRVENSAEFEASDDDEMARSHGATRQNGNKRPFTDYGNEEAENGGDKRTRTAPTSPKDAEETTATDNAHDPNDDTIEEIASAEKNEPEVAQEEDETKKPPKEATDNDGDVGMTDSGPAEDSTTIKKEDGEPEAAPAAPAPEKEDGDNSGDAATEERKPDEPSKETPKEAEAAPERTPQPEEKPKEADAPEAMDVDTEKDKAEETTEEKKETTEASS